MCVSLGSLSLDVRALARTKEKSLKHPVFQSRHVLASSELSVRVVVAILESNNTYSTTLAHQRAAVEGVIRTVFRTYKSESLAFLLIILICVTYFSVCVCAFVCVQQLRDTL